MRSPLTDTERILALFDDERYPTPVVITEEDVAAEHRTLVVGGAGTGKSELLGHLVRTAPAARPVVLIRLADQRFTPGETARVLARWASSGLSADGNVNVSAEAIEGGALHFLLDGLDEVPAELQSAAAELIRDVAGSFPQHAFTITSRPTGAVSVLSDATADGVPSWAVLQIEPGVAWRDRYLAHRGLTMAELLSAMPELQDARELCATPFVLSRVADLYERGAIREFKHLGDLLSAIIGSQLEREEPLIALAPAQVRSWLQDVALAGLLTGKRSFTADELGRFPVAEGATGGPQELASMLVQRLLLAEDEGIYRFAHRMLGEELAAEALALRGPGAPLLDASLRG